MKLENKFRVKFTTALRGYFGSTVYIQKNHGSNFSAGLPDLYIAQRDAGEVHIELKASEHYEPFDWSLQPTPLQRNTLVDLHNAGARIGVLIYYAQEKVLHAFHGDLLRRIFDLVRDSNGPGFTWDPRGDPKLARMDHNREHQYITWDGGPSDVLDLSRVTWGLPPETEGARLRKVVRGARGRTDA